MIVLSDVPLLVRVARTIATEKWRVIHRPRFRLVALFFDWVGGFPGFQNVFAPSLRSRRLPADEPVGFLRAGCREFVESRQRRDVLEALVDGREGREERILQRR